MSMRKQAILVIIAVVVIAAAGSYIAWSYLQAPSIEIHDARAVITPKALAIYMVIHNHGFGADCLVGAEIASPFRAEAELHETIVSGGTASMRRVSSICIAGRSKVDLAPGGHHIMVMGNFSREIGELTLILHFQKSGDIAIKVTIASEGEIHTH